MSLRSLMPFGRTEGFATDPFQTLRRQIDRLFDEPVMRLAPPAAGWSDGAMIPRVDMSETDKSIEVTAELPGVAREDIQLTLGEGSLTVAGEKKQEKESKDNGFHMMERSYGAFQRTLSLPCDIEADKVSADFKNGILHVSLPKAASARSALKKIEVKAA